MYAQQQAGAMPACGQQPQQLVMTPAQLQRYAQADAVARQLEGLANMGMLLACEVKLEYQGAHGQETRGARVLGGLRADPWDIFVRCRCPECVPKPALLLDDTARAYKESCVMSLVEFVLHCVPGLNKFGKKFNIDVRQIALRYVQVVTHKPGGPNGVYDVREKYLDDAMVDLGHQVEAEGSLRGHWVFLLDFKKPSTDPPPSRWLLHQVVDFDPATGQHRLQAADGSHVLVHACFNLMHVVPPGEPPAPPAHEQYASLPCHGHLTMQGYVTKRSIDQDPGMQLVARAERAQSQPGAVPGAFGAAAQPPGAPPHAATWAHQAAHGAYPAQGAPPQQQHQHQPYPQQQQPPAHFPGAYAGPPQPQAYAAGGAWPPPAGAAPYAAAPPQQQQPQAYAQAAGAPGAVPVAGFPPQPHPYAQQQPQHAQPQGTWAAAPGAHPAPSTAAPTPQPSHGFAAPAAGAAGGAAQPPLQTLQTQSSSTAPLPTRPSSQAHAYGPAHTSSSGPSPSQGTAAAPQWPHQTVHPPGAPAAAAPTWRADASEQFAEISAKRLAIAPDAAPGAGAHARPTPVATPVAFASAGATPLASPATGLGGAAAAAAAAATSSAGRVEIGRARAMAEERGLSEEVWRMAVEAGRKKQEQSARNRERTMLQMGLLEAQSGDPAGAWERGQATAAGAFPPASAHPGAAPDPRAPGGAGVPNAPHPSYAAAAAPGALTPAPSAAPPGGAMAPPPGAPVYGGAAAAAPSTSTSTAASDTAARRHAEASAAAAQRAAQRACVLVPRGELQRAHGAEDGGGGDPHARALCHRAASELVLELLGRVGLGQDDEVGMALSTLSSTRQAQLGPQQGAGGEAGEAPLFWELYGQLQALESAVVAASPDASADGGEEAAAAALRSKLRAPLQQLILTQALKATQVAPKDEPHFPWRHDCWEKVNSLPAAALASTS